MMTVLERGAVTLTAAQATIMARALADAEQYRRESAAAWCADCAAAQGGACPNHLAYLAPASAYRELAAELAHATKSAGRDVPAPRPASDLSRLGQERTMTNTMAAKPPAARSLHEVCEAARMATCGECWAIPGDECVYTSIPVSVPVTPGTPVLPARGYHVARFGRALRRGLIRGPELIAVLQALDAFTNSTIVYDQAAGESL
jgi:hypothetical protein